MALKGKADISNNINIQFIQPLVDADRRLARSEFTDFTDPNKPGEGSAIVDRLSNPRGIFQKRELDLSGNRTNNYDSPGRRPDGRAALRSSWCRWSRLRTRRSTSTSTCRATSKEPKPRTCRALSATRAVASLSVIWTTTIFR